MHLGNRAKYMWDNVGVLKNWNWPLLCWSLEHKIHLIYTVSNSTVLFWDMAPSIQDKAETAATIILHLIWWSWTGWGIVRMVELNKQQHTIKITWSQARQWKFSGDKNHNILSSNKNHETLKKTTTKCNKPVSQRAIFKAVTFICLLYTFAKQPVVLALGFDRIYYGISTMLTKK